MPGAPGAPSAPNLPTPTAADDDGTALLDELAPWDAGEQGELAEPVRHGRDGKGERGGKGKGERGDKGKGEPGRKGGGELAGKDFAFTIDVPGEPQKFSKPTIGDKGMLAACSGGGDSEVTRGRFRTRGADGDKGKTRTTVTSAGAGAAGCSAKAQLTSRPVCRSRTRAGDGSGAGRLPCFRGISAPRHGGDDAERLTLGHRGALATPVDFAVIVTPHDGIDYDAIIDQARIVYDARACLDSSAPNIYIL